MTHEKVVVEADGGSRGNPGPAGFGALIRDGDTGEVIAQTAESIGHASNNVAEYRGLIAGLELYLEHTPDALLEVRMDSKLVIEQMAGRWKVKHPNMRSLASTAQRLAPFGTTWTWVPRERNADADRLANLAMDAAERGEVSDVGQAGLGPAVLGQAVGTGQTSTSADPTPDASEPPSPGSGSPAGASQRQSLAPNPMLGWSSSLGEATTLIFLRHGVTRHTAARKFSGPGGDDPGLIEEGWEQARRAAAALARVGGIDAIVASPLRRTRDTASVVSISLGLEVRIDDGFREAAFGDWDGYTLSQVEQTWPVELDAWLQSMDYRPPGGESIVEVQRRVEDALDRTLARYQGKTVVVVSHVNPIKLSVRYCLDAPLEIINKMLLAPASLTTVSFYASGASSLRQFSALP
ncbi:MAG: bifunctional RNase H/acid phosphatase [Propionibacteriales bacterium]|nr:bifunctional RNase H/acid phosphatase [Propionibacteriales bacterium]